MVAEEIVAGLLLDLAIIIIVAKSFEELISYYGYPPVLGDILAGIILGPTVLDILSPTTVEELDLIKWLGIISLLFLAGLETKFSVFMKSLRQSFNVALGGIFVSYAVGYFSGIMLGLDSATSLFIGAILTATSVGLTVKTLTDIGAMGTRISATILGAAVLDDVGGLIVLGLTVALVTTGVARIEDLIITVIIAVVFYILLVMGLHRSSKIIWKGIRHISHLQDTSIALLLAITLVFAWASVKVNLSLVVGAYAVGLAFSEITGIEGVTRRFSLIPDIFASIFFVLSTATIDLKQYLIHPEYLVIIGVITLMAFVGKIFGCGLASKLSGFNMHESMFIGFGMLPRAEVSLVITSLGVTYGVLDESIIAAVVVIIYSTSIITPLVLSRQWQKIRKRYGK